MEKWKAALIIAGTAFIFPTAFPLYTKKQMFARAARNQLNIDVDLRIAMRKKIGSELSGETGRLLEASHWHHEKDDEIRRQLGIPSYTDPESGILITSPEHLGYHLYYRHSPNKIGLTTNGNEFAIRELTNRILTENKKLGITEPIKSIERHEVQKWIEYNAVEA